MRIDGYSGDIAGQKGRILGWLDDLCVSIDHVTFEEFHDNEDLGPQLVAKIPINPLYYVHLSSTHTYQEFPDGGKQLVGWGLIGTLCHAKGRARDLHDSNESTRLELARILIDAARHMPAADQDPIGPPRPPLED